MGFLDTAGGVALGAGIAVIGQWFADRRAVSRERRADNHGFRERVTENLQDSIKQLWREYTTTPVVKGDRAPIELTKAMVDASAWRSRLADQSFADEIKTWLDQLADAIKQPLSEDQQSALTREYRRIMQRLGASLRELHSD